MRGKHVLLVLFAVTVAVAPAGAQEPADSLVAELARLRARLDSLEQLIDRLSREGRDTTGTGGELAALRAAAQRAAAGQAPPAPQASRTSSLSILNPEISVTGDFVGAYVDPAGESGAASATPREFEFSFQSALDPYTRTKIFLTREADFPIAGAEEEEEEEEEHGSGVEVEEAYLYWVGLPGGIGLKLGKFRQEVGLYNRWHTHALFEVERPLAVRELLGEDGLIQTGASVQLPAVRTGRGTHTLTLETTTASNEALFDASGQLSHLGRFTTFWDAGRSVYFQLGATGVIGRNTEADFVSRLVGIDAQFRWAPPNRRMDTDLQLKGEWYFAERETAGVPVRAKGGYGQANFRFARQWVIGTRVDWVDPYDPAPNLLQVAPSISWWQSEWVRLRLQYMALRPEGGALNHTLLFQVVWAMGPHKHETY
jgi:hypothetical protein